MQRTIPEKKARRRPESIRCQAPKWVLFAQQWNVCRNLIEGSCKYLEFLFRNTREFKKSKSLVNIIDQLDLKYDYKWTMFSVKELYDDGMS